MHDEIVSVKIRDTLHEEENYYDLYLFDEDPANAENVKIELHSYGDIISFSADNYFDALIMLRQQLEQEGKLLFCMGATRNVYPSAMSLSMGCGRSAYKLTMHKQALQRDVVDIFEASYSDDCVTIAEQKQYFSLWIESLREK